MGGVIWAPFGLSAAINLCREPPRTITEDPVMKAEADERKNRRILIIDDNPAIHADLRKILVPHDEDDSALNQATATLFEEQPHVENLLEGVELGSAFQGEEGVQSLQQAIREGRPYSLAFVDVRMPPGWDGIKTIQRLWDVDPELLVVICTAYSDIGWEDLVGELGVTDRFLVLKKPFDHVEVRQLALAMTEKWRIARTDLATGLLNRRAFFEYFDYEWSRAQRDELPLSCVMLDIDFFKNVNDTHGHHVGDQVLLSLANLLTDDCRGTDYVCRYGGEEICLLLPETDEQGAAVWAARVKDCIATMRIPEVNRDLRITVSMGLSEFHTDLQSPEQLINHADQALLVAKHSGRNRFVRYSTFAAGETTDSLRRSHDTVFDDQCAADLMQEVPVILSHGTTVAQAVDALLEADAISAPVVDEEGQLAGIVSEKDLLTHLITGMDDAETLSNIVQAPTVSYAAETPLREIVEFLRRVMLRHVVIVDQGRPTGVISRTDVLRWYRRHWPKTAAGVTENATPVVGTLPTIVAPMSNAAIQ